MKILYTYKKLVSSPGKFLGCFLCAALFLILVLGCEHIEGKNANEFSKNAEFILGNPDFPAISYGGYRENTRAVQPTVEELKEDLKILYALGIRVVRTYNTKLKHASNVIQAIHELKNENSSFEMYVMLGAWISCRDAFTANPDHNLEDEEENKAEIDRAVSLAQQFPDIVKIIAVGNEAMVKWAASYFVQPEVILNWVTYVQNLKKTGDLPKDLWITSSDNFASWGGGGEEYHVPELKALIMAVDFISLHTYPMHDTHYNPDFWGVEAEEKDLPDLAKIDSAMVRARNYAIQQYHSTKEYIEKLGVIKPIHIGETGWATYSNGFYGNDGSAATDEYKSAKYYDLIRTWTAENKIACFYFEAFDESWKDAANEGGSENHFGLFTTDGKAKYVLWDKVDEGVFEGLGRNGKPIEKTFDGNFYLLTETIGLPPLVNESSEMIE